MNCDAIIYDKSQKLKSKYPIVQLNNVGREAHTYLTHIVQNYERLSDYTVFMQDDTKNHIIDTQHFVEFCQNFKGNFKLYPCSWRFDQELKRTYVQLVKNGYAGGPTYAGKPSKDEIDVFCKEFNIEMPKAYITETSAFFVASKEIIHKRPKQFYVKALNWLLQSEYDRSFSIEHLWCLIFDKPKLVYL
jgi:hypothetical protein